MIAESAIHERAPAKVNLLLHVGPRRPDGLHELCSIFASIDLADEVVVSKSAGEGDRIRCAGIEGPNICGAALAALRTAAGDRAGPTIPPLDVEIAKRIPVAAGLGGGSADAAAVLRAGNAIAGNPLEPSELRRVAARVGADVPSQVEPRHALVGGAGERVEPVALPAMTLVLAPQEEGLATADVYREADRIGATRSMLDRAAVKRLAAGPLTTLAAGLENDLQPAAVSLRPELEGTIAALRDGGALAALVTGSGPTVFGVFADHPSAQRAAARVSGAVVAALG